MINSTEQRIKEVARYQKEIRKLHAAKHALGYYKLDKAIPHGEYRHLALRADISRRNDAAVFQSLIDASGHFVWGSTRKKVDHHWVKALRRCKTLYYPGFKEIEESEFQKLSLKAKSYYAPVFYRFCRHRGAIYKYRCIAPSHYFITAYSRAYITHRKIIDPELERKMDELEALIMRRGYYELSWHGNSYTSHFSRGNSERRARRRGKMFLRYVGEEVMPRDEQWIYLDMSKRI